MITFGLLLAVVMNSYATYYTLKVAYEDYTVLDWINTQLISWFGIDVPTVAEWGVGLYAVLSVYSIIVGVHLPVMVATTAMMVVYVVILGIIGFGNYER